MKILSTRIREILFEFRKNGKIKLFEKSKWLRDVLCDQESGGTIGSTLKL